MEKASSRAEHILKYRPGWLNPNCVIPCIELNYVGLEHRG